MGITKLVCVVVLSLLIVPMIVALDHDDAVRGIRLYNQGKLEEAREILERLLRTGHAGARETAVLGMTHTRLREYDRAREALERAMQMDPGESLVHIALGMLEFELQDFQAAYRHFRRADHFDPGSRQAVDGMVACLANRAVLLYNEGERESAEELLLDGLRLDPESADLIAMLIRIRKEQGRTDSLVGLYRRLLAVQPHNAQAHAELGTLLARQGLLEAAEEAFREAERLDTDEPYPYLHLARLARDRGRPASTILSRLHAAIGKAVHKSGMIRMQAATMVQGTEGRLGREELESLKRLSAMAAEPRLVLGQALSMLAEVHETAKALEQDLERLSTWYPHNLELQLALGRVLEQQGRFEEAERRWRRVLSEFPMAADAHLGLARSLESLGRAAEARIACLRARDIAPDDPDVYTALGRLYEAGGEEEALRQWYDELYSRERTNVVLLEALAALEEKLGYHDQAAERRSRIRTLRERDQDSRDS